MKPAIKKAFLDTEDGQVLYRILGEGEALLLLHMTPRSGDEFRELMPIFAQQRCAIAMDLMGMGDSDPPPKPYSMADYARSAIALLDNLDLPKASILGNHTGAYIAAEIAAAYPERLEKLILCNIDLFNPTEQATLTERIHTNLQSQIDAAYLTARWSVREPYTGSADLNYRYFLDELKCHGHPPYGPLAVAQYCSTMPERLCSIQCPTLILSGSEDLKLLENLQLSTAENRQAVARAIPQAQFTEVEGGTLCMMNQIYEEIASIVINFLNEVGSS